MRTKRPTVTHWVGEVKVCEYADKVIAAPTNPINKELLFWFIFPLSSSIPFSLLSFFFFFFFFSNSMAEETRFLIFSQSQNIKSHLLFLCLYYNINTIWSPNSYYIFIWLSFMERSNYRSCLLCPQYYVLVFFF